MKLHEHPDEFEAIVLDIAEQQNVRADVLEKDYYVTLILQELSQHQNEWKAYFKGGTALYKALSSMNRFSEDIDLTVSVNDCSSNNQKKIRLEKSAKGFSYLERLKDDKENVDSNGNITCIYGYHSIFTDLDYDPLQRFGRVKVEATSFTVSESIELMTTSPMIYIKASNEQRKVLEGFGVSPFDILTIKLERIFVDKIFAAEFYYRRFKESKDANAKNTFAFDVAKHIYDLMVLHECPKIQRLLSSRDNLKELFALKRTEEQSRQGGIPGALLIKDFSYLDTLMEDSDFPGVYDRMQEIYIFNDGNKIALRNAKDVIYSIQKIEE